MSNQLVPTPKDFLEAVQRRFGPFVADLAANKANRVTDVWYGPGSADPDSLAPGVHWPIGGLLWLNPPFDNVAAFAEKCAAERKRGCRIALIGPAAVCTGWFVDHVAPCAYVFELAPRVFKVNIRDCVLALYEPAGYLGRESWRWKTIERAKGRSTKAKKALATTAATER